MQPNATESSGAITVRCPSCSHEFPLGDGVLGSVRHGLEKELSAGILEREKALGQKRREIEEQEALLKKREADLAEQVQSQVAEKIAKEAGEIRAREAKRAAQEQETILKAIREELGEKTDALKKAREQELELLQQKRELEDSKEALALQVQQTLDKERGKLKEQLQAAADEANRMKIAEKEKVIHDLVAKLDEAQRKAAQGSQQTQGEVLELDFEQQLRAAFPSDPICEISKGIRGADVSQEVRSPVGRTCGMILYETKRAQNWSDAWVAKLKEDMRNAKAEVGVLITEVLPKGLGKFGEMDGVWICDPTSAIPLAHVLRTTLREVALARGQQEGAKEKMQILYSYLTGPEFRARVGGVIEAFTAMKHDLDRERRAFTKAWSKREKHLNTVLESMAGMIGDVQAISGNALKDIPALELDDTPQDEDGE